MKSQYFRNVLSDFRELFFKKSFNYKHKLLHVESIKKPILSLREGVETAGEFYKKPVYNQKILR